MEKLFPKEKTWQFLVSNLKVDRPFYRKAYYSRNKMATTTKRIMACYFLLSRGHMGYTHSNEYSWKLLNKRLIPILTNAVWSLLSQKIESQQLFQWQNLINSILLTSFTWLIRVLFHAKHWRYVELINFLLWTFEKTLCFFYQAFVVMKDTVVALVLIYTFCNCVKGKLIGKIVYNFVRTKSINMMTIYWEWKPMYAVAVVALIRVDNVFL